MFSRVVSKYAHYLETHPFITKGITSGVIGAAGDVAAQKMTGDDFDMKRFTTCRSTYLNLIH